MAIDKYETVMCDHLFNCSIDKTIQLFENVGWILFVSKQLVNNLNFTMFGKNKLNIEWNNDIK